MTKPTLPNSPRADSVDRNVLTARESTLIDVEESTPPIGISLSPFTGEVTSQTGGLTASEADFHALAESVPQVVWITRADGWNIFFNKRWFDFTGLTPEQSHGHGWSTPFHPDDQPLATEAWNNAVTLGAVYSIQCRLRRHDGEYCWWLVRGTPQFDSAGQIARWFGTCTDIHDLKTAELNLSRVNRALEMLTRSNEALINAPSEQALLEKICDIAVEIGDYRMAWAGFAEDDEQRLITPRTHSGVEDGYLGEVVIHWKNSSSGPAARAIRTGKPIVIEDLSLEPSFAEWLQPALRRGYRGLVVLPIGKSPGTRGVLALYTGESRRISEDEIQNLERLAGNLSSGLARLKELSDTERLHAALVKVAEGVTTATGVEFFSQLARRMAEAVDATAGFVVELNPEESGRVHGVVAIVGASNQKATEFRMQAGPFEQLLREGTTVLEETTGQFLAKIPKLPELGAKSLVSRQIIGSTGTILGLAFVAFVRKLPDAEVVRSTLDIFSTRAALEIERQRAYLQLREQAALLDGARDAIFVVDMDDRIIFWNKGAESVYGWTAAEVVGAKSIDILVSNLSAYHEARSKLFANDEWDGELPRRAKKGNITVAARWTLVRDASGRPKSIFAIDTDITEKKKFESQFLRAQRMESIGTLAGGIAHDLNNVLGPIILSAELLEESVRKDEDRELLDTLLGSARRGAALVTQVLSFAKGMEGERIQVNPVYVMNDLMKVMRDTFPKSIAITFTPARELSAVLGDPNQLYQVLLNLCVNARDAMPDGGELNLSMENVDIDDTYTELNPGSSPGAYVKVCATDTGVGIPSDIQSRIFEPFFTTKSVTSGTGLGLSTSLGIVKSHGGFINVYSELGKGTRFSVYFPAYEKSHSESALRDQAAEPPRGTGELILVIDDDSAVRKAAARTLERFGYHTLIASNGAEGVALFAAHRADVAMVLTDMMMPIMDGPAAIHALRTIDPNVVVVGSSGNPSMGGRARATAAKADLFLSKPYTGTSLLTIVGEALAFRKARVNPSLN